MVLKVWPSALSIPSNPDTVIWRYMDFAKFVAMLNDRALFFPCAELFNDPYEGALGQDKKLRRDSLLREFYKPEVAEDQAQKLAELGRHNRQSTFISCWHVNEHESDGMWKLYSQTSEAVVIQSTYQRLKNVLPYNTHVYNVNYIDYQRESVPDGHSLYPFFYKRIAFEHEKELRAIIHGLAPNAPRTKVLPINVDLDHLITKIRVAPSAPNWFAELVANVCRKYEIEKEVVRSSLADEPFF